MDDATNDIEPLAKGFVIRGLLREVKETYPPGIKALLSELPENLKPHFARPILHNLWYPYSVFTGLLEQMFHNIGKSAEGYLKELGIKTAERDLSTFYRMVLTITSPRIIGIRSRTFWPQMFRPGSFSMEEYQSVGMTLVLKDFPCVHPIHCPLICGYIQGLGKNWRKGFQVEHDLCVHRGSIVCSFQCRWQS